MQSIHIIHHVPLFSLLLSLVALAVGCQGQGDQGHRIHGTVTYRGEPVPAGTLMLEPDSSKGNVGRAAVLAIRHGKFDSDANHTGFIGGPHRITVQGFDGKVVDPEFAPEGAPLAGGRSYVKSFDLPNEEVELDLELAEVLDRRGR